MPKMTRNQHRTRALALMGIVDREPDVIRAANNDDLSPLTQLDRDILTLAQLHATLACVPDRVAGE